MLLLYAAPSIKIMLRAEKPPIVEQRRDRLGDENKTLQGSRAATVVHRHHSAANAATLDLKTK